MSCQCGRSLLYACSTSTSKTAFFAYRNEFFKLKGHEQHISDSMMFRLLPLALRLSCRAPLGCIVSVLQIEEREETCLPAVQNILGSAIVQLFCCWQAANKSQLSSVDCRDVDSCLNHTLFSIFTLAKGVSLPHIHKARVAALPQQRL